MVIETRPSAFLEYVGEDPAVYRVRNGAEVETVPKSVRPYDPQPLERPAALRQATRLLRWALVGLLPAGLGALLLAPLAGLAAARGLRQAEEPVDRRRLVAVLALAVLTLLAALPLVYLLGLHA